MALRGILVLATIAVLAHECKGYRTLDDLFRDEYTVYALSRNPGLNKRDPVTPVPALKPFTVGPQYLPDPDPNLDIPISGDQFSVSEDDEETNDEQKRQEKRQHNENSGSDRTNMGKQLYTRVPSSLKKGICPWYCNYVIQLK